MKSLPYYTLDGLTQIGDFIFTKDDIITVKCLAAKPTLAQIYLKNKDVPAVFVMKADLFDYLMPISFTEKLDRPFNTGLTGVESVVGSVTVATNDLNFASSGVDAVYTRDLDALSLTEGKLHSIKLFGVAKTGNGSVKIKLGAHEQVFTSAQIAAILPDPIVVELMLDSDTDDLEISLINCTVASTLKFGRFNISEKLQIPLQQFDFKTSNGLTVLGQVYIGPNYDGVIWPAPIAGVRRKADSATTTVAQVYFADGSNQGLYIDDTTVTDYLNSYTTIE